MATMTFASPGAFAAFLATVPARMAVAQRSALDRAAALVEREAKAEIGHYQGAAGPFHAWAPLAAGTVADRVSRGYAPNEPLLREGTLRASIGRSVGDAEAVVGSDSPIAVFQEMGTRTIPPRSFLGGAGVRKGDDVANILGQAVVMALFGAGANVPIRG